MRKLLTIILVLSLTLSLCACNAKTPAADNNPKPADDVIRELQMEELTCEVITTEPGQYVPVATTYTDIPEEFRAKCANPGTFVREEYTTDLYYGGETIEKYVQVYLPYGYDENDTQTKYNVLYHAHGNGGSQDLFEKTTYRYPLDHIFSTAGVDPVIIVFITYYTGRVDEAGEKEAGDGRSANVPGDFYLEVLDDIIPVVETKYNTYLKGMEPTLENIEATREHRGYSGYSRGGRSTYYTFRYALPYFKWFTPMSATCDGYAISSLPTKYQGSELEAVRSTYELEDGHGSAPNEDVLRYIQDALEEFPGYDFFIYATSGMEKDRPMVYDQMTYFINSGFFSYGSDTSVNNLYYSMSRYDHTDAHSPASWFNTLRVLFH